MRPHHIWRECWRSCHARDQEVPAMRKLREADAAASQNVARFEPLPDLCSFYCLACDEWHVEEASANQKRGGESAQGKALQ